MPDTSTDIQVENETVEPYRGLMIFRTLHEGQIVYRGGKSKIYPKQTFYAIVSNKQMPNAFGNDKGEERVLVSHDVEGVRGLIDKYAPGTGLIQASV